MINPPHSLTVEATSDREFFGFYSPDLEGFTGIGRSVEDCTYKARWGMKNHVKLLRQRRMRVPPAKCNPTIGCAESAQAETHVNRTIFRTIK